MPRVCYFTGKKTSFGNQVTHRVGVPDVDLIARQEIRAPIGRKRLGQRVPQLASGPENKRSHG